MTGRKGEKLDVGKLREGKARAWSTSKHREELGREVLDADSLTVISSISSKGVQKEEHS